MQKIVVMFVVLLMALSSFAINTGTRTTERERITDVAERENDVVEPNLEFYPTMSYQGLLKDNDGKKIEDGVYKISFKIYDSQKSKASIWKEVQEVEITNGIINCFIGSEEKLDLPFDRQYWLSVGVNDDELPRMIMAGTPYSLHARRIAEDAIVGGENITVTKDDDGKIVLNGEGSSSKTAGNLSDTYLSDGTTPAYGTINNGCFNYSHGNYGLRSHAFGNATTAVGNNSFTAGKDSRALGITSIALGDQAKADGDYSIALGYDNSATGDYSVALGAGNTSSGYMSTAIGRGSEATAVSSMVLGNWSKATNERSFSFGSSCIASGYGSTALGYISSASGEYSVAIGKSISNPIESSCLIGFSSPSMIVRQNFVTIGYDTLDVRNIINSNNNDKALYVNGEIISNELTVHNLISATELQVDSIHSHLIYTDSLVVDSIHTEFISASDSLITPLANIKEFYNTERLFTFYGDIVADDLTISNPITSTELQVDSIHSHLIYTDSLVVDSIHTEFISASDSLITPLANIKEFYNSERLFTFYGKTNVDILHTDSIYARTINIVDTVHAGVVKIYDSIQGSTSTATGLNATALGYRSEAIGNYSFAVGDSSIATGLNSVSIGHGNIVSGSYATAFGKWNTSLSRHTTTIGNSNITGINEYYGDCSFTGGLKSKTEGSWSFTFGQDVVINQNSCYAFGINLDNIYTEDSDDAGSSIYDELDRCFMIGFNYGEDSDQSQLFVNQNGVCIGFTHDEIKTNLPSGLTNSIYVKETVYAKNLELSTNVWPDYVFKDDYNLKPLNEIEQFINENNHLPGIITQKDALENGVNVGDIQIK
ncbi:MAG: hypothetical protein GQ534_03495, partial [Candidatus Delongbacteria bacterium]|nr:hypothetical protein [Candidatus Delongbacteria bacterium]